MTLSGDAVRRAPARVRSRGLQDAIATTPGWSTEDNGLLHVRGIDDGFLYVIDGMPVYERIDGLFGVSPDPSMIDQVNVMTGFISPEFGLKSGGVIEVRSTSRASDRWLGTLEAGTGSDEAREFSSVAGGSLGRTAALTVGVSGQASSRFLDPVHPDNLHNDGGTLSGGGQFTWTPSAQSLLTAVVGFGRSTFDVPHGEQQEVAGQDQRQRARKFVADPLVAALLVGQQRVAGGRVHRCGPSAALIGAQRTLPVTTDADRVTSAERSARQRHASARPALSSRSAVKRRGCSLREDFSFAVTDLEEAEEADLSDGAMAYTPEALRLSWDRNAHAVLGLRAGFESARAIG